MDKETDVLEFDFPDYEEPYPPFPDVKVALFDKDSSYSRNRDIADKLYAVNAEKEKERAKKLRMAERKRRKRAKRLKRRPLRRILALIGLFLFVEVFSLFISVGGIEALAEYFKSKRNWTAEFQQAAISEEPYVPPQPFEQDDAGEYGTIYTTDKISFVFLPV